MDAGKEAHLDPGFDNVGALKNEAREPEAIFPGAPEPKGIRPQGIRGADLQE
jgi:hypothetical protein